MTELYSGLNTPTLFVDHRLIEFRQKYENGQTVVKRGLNATPMVLKKYRIGEKEVMSFTNHEGHMRALTAFHFHPNFPESQRQPYMESHHEGQELAEIISNELAAEIRAGRQKWRLRTRRAGKILGVIFHTLVIYLIAYHPDSR